MPIRAAVVGVGHLGQHHARILAAMPDVELVGVADVRPEQAALIAKRCGTKAYSDFHELIDQVDAVSIAVPTVGHVAAAAPFLERGVAALIEKPLAPTAAEGAHLVEIARRSGAILQVGHIERFNPAWRAVSKLRLRPKYVRAERQGTYTFRSTDIGVVHDLMIHDLDLVLSLTDADPIRVEALGVRILSDSEDVANARVTFADGLIADFTANRVAQTAVRGMKIWAREGFASLDFAAKTGTVIRPSKRLLERKHMQDLEDVDLSQIAKVRERLFGTVLELEEIEGDSTEPLALELAEFIDSATGGPRPSVSGAAGQRALELAEAVCGKIRSHAWEGTAEGPLGPNIWGIDAQPPIDARAPIVGLAGPHLRKDPALARRSLRDRT